MTGQEARGVLSSVPTLNGERFQGLLVRSETCALLVLETVVGRLFRIPQHDGVLRETTAIQRLNSTICLRERLDRYGQILQYRWKSRGAHYL